MSDIQTDQISGKEDVKVIFSGQPGDSLENGESFLVCRFRIGIFKDLDIITGETQDRPLAGKIRVGDMT